MSSIKKNETWKSGNTSYSRGNGGLVKVTDPHKSTRYESATRTNLRFNQGK